MKARIVWRVGAAVGLVLTALAVNPPAWAHNAGRVELLVTNLTFSDEGHGTGSGVKVSAELIDRDSGESAGGFAIVVSAVGPDGAEAGPVTLTDPVGSGHYEGTLAVRRGAWTVTAKAEQGTSALPALGSTSRARVTLDENGVVAKDLGGGGSDVGMWVALAGAGLALGLGALLLLARRPGRPAGTPMGQRALPAVVAVAVGLAGLGAAVRPAGAQEAQTTVPQYGSRPVAITLEVRTDYHETVPSPLYIPLRARLTDAGTGQPVADPYTVRAGVRLPDQPSTEAYDFAYPHGTVEGAEAGVYNGLVIVPAGGRWTVIVNAYNIRDAETERLPRSLGLAQIEVEATGAALQTTEGRRSDDVAGNIDPRAETSEVALLFVHTIVAGAWFALAALLILLGLPNRRRFLAAGLVDLLDRNFRRLTQGLLWTTILVWATGLLNLQKSVAFAPPLSSAQATQLFRLPYAKPYTFALYSKIGVYALLTLCAVALAREARRRVSEFDDARFRAELALAAESGASPAPSHPYSRPAVPFTPRRTATAVATRPRPEATLPGAPAGDAASPASGAFRVAAIGMGLGGTAIIGCVTILKYAHILSETVRGLP